MCINQKNTCDGCGKNTDGLMMCTLYDGDDEIHEHLCPDCIIDSGYCLGCGMFSAGIDSFEFSDIDGYCEHCTDQIKTDSGEYYKDTDIF